MFRIYHRCNSALFLGLCDSVDSQGCLTAGLRSVDLYDSALRVSSDSQSMVESDGAARYYLMFIPLWLISQLHDRAFPIVFFNLVDRRLQRFQFPGINLGAGVFYCFFSHNVLFFVLICGLFRILYKDRKNAVIRNEKLVKFVEL